VYVSEVTAPGGNVGIALCSACISEVTNSGGNVGIALCPAYASEVTTLGGNIGIKFCGRMILRLPLLVVISGLASAGV
jgi:hypothetical protein